MDQIFYSLAIHFVNFLDIPSSLFVLVFVLYIPRFFVVVPRRYTTILSFEFFFEDFFFHFAKFFIQ